MADQRPPPPPSRLPAIGRAFTYAVTNVTKLAGVYVALHESLSHAQIRPVVLAVSAFMMAGAQVSEGVILAAIDKFLAQPPPEATQPSRRP
jgi:hypothetical protein